MSMAAVSRLGEAWQYGAQAPDVEERLALLAEASRLLADASLEPPAVMERLCALVVPLLGSACALRLRSEDGRWLRTVASASASPEARPLFQYLIAPVLRADEGPSAEVLRTGVAMVVPRLELEDLRRQLPPQHHGMLERLPLTGSLVLPLRARGRGLGTLTVWREPSAAPFDAGEQLLLQELADRAALALDVARAYAAERQARQSAEVAAGRLARLQRVTAELSQVLTASRMAEVVVDQGVEAVGARSGGLWLVEPGESQARLLRCKGEDSRMLADVFGVVPLEQPSPITEAIRAARPVWLETPDALVASFPELAERCRRARGTPAPSSVCLPLAVDGRALGTLLFTFAEPHAFDGDERAFLELLAHHAAQALARARLLEQEQRARAALRDAHQTLAAVIQASPAAIMLLDMDGTVRLWNPAAERMFGWTADEVLGQVLPAVPESQQEEFRRSLESVARGRSLSGVETQQRRRDGTPIPVALWTALLRSPAGDPQCLGIVVDITERKRSEDSQRFLAEAGEVLASSLEQEETLERVAHLAVPTYAEACGVFLADEAGAVRCVATAFADTPRVESDSPLAAAAEVVSRVMATGAPELCASPAPDTPDPARWSARAWLCVPLEMRGQTQGALMFVTSRRSYDVRDLELARELARRAALAIDNARLYREARQAIRLREEFLSIASHELKTPITALQLQVQSLLRGGLERSPESPAPERLRRGLEAVGRQVKRQTKLIDELLDMSRISAGRLELSPEPLDLGTLVREVAERFEPELARTDTKLHLVLATEACGQWDRLRLDQVLTNLLSNAVKYGRGNPVRVELSATGDRVRMEVRDGGIGIAAEHLPRLFHRFERAVSERNYGGFGLGLWITRQIVEAMGGHITVRSEPGVGSTFTVELPRAEG
ncbi:GAF domain-containing protein [Pyxidicoccus fallax]|uniref:histidine kinase n=1 Tax=Pyxidicoccus fallax TaxID=394095 RepID=A0A848LKH7_9BACT|nr:GAF domain-containing protein [Pyxidicoccus fallax]NMO18216.1 GAF domain-containing protein [Pyxidicoccus fallax]NPC80158.1 GAF domain-containing protein [Pyxidicoccus fallax]